MLERVRRVVSCNLRRRCFPPNAARGRVPLGVRLGSGLQLAYCQEMFRDVVARVAFVHLGFPLGTGDITSYTVPISIPRKPCHVRPIEIPLGYVVDSRGKNKQQLADGSVRDPPISCEA